MSRRFDGDALRGIFAWLFRLGGWTYLLAVAALAGFFADETSHGRMEARWILFGPAALIALVLLDWGCGLGDLLEYLRFQGFTGTYIGADINKEFIAEARKKYADDPRASFFVSDSLRDAARLEYDYCLLSGVFNIAAEDTGAELKNTVQTLFKGARRGVAFNALSTHAKEKKPDLAYFDPFALGEWCAREITPYVALRHDYRGGNFTVYLYKDRGVDF